MRSSSLSTTLPSTFLLLGLLGTVAPELHAQQSGPSIQSLLSGFGSVGYASTTGDDLESDFSASTSLVTLFRVEQNVLVEGELELALHDQETLVVLEHAEVHYLGFERLHLAVGKFHVPFGVWMHPNWINRMPTPPLLYEDTHGEPAAHALLPILFDVGVMARLNVPVARGWRTSAGFWVTQGPRPGVAEHGHDEGGAEPGPEPDAPRLAYGSNYEDNNADKMVGLQLRAVSARGLTLQLSGFRAAWDDDASLTVSAANASFVWDPQGGPFRLFDLRGEAALLGQEYLHDDEIHSVTSGGYYVQASRRVGSFEPVIRWSHLPRAEAGEGPLVERRRQLAIGLDYWLSPSVPVKAAYDWELDGTDRIFLEWAVGF